MSQPRFSCLLYHGIGEEERLGYLSATRFRRHVEVLVSQGYTIEGFDGVLRRLKSGQWPERYIVFTFDDGHRSTIEALEILGELGGSATFFIATRACTTDSRYVDRETLRRLAAHTHIGSHSVTHRRMDQLPSSELRAELVDSKAWLEDATGVEVETFSAPSGAVNPRVCNEALAAGYSLLGDSIPWWNQHAAVDRERRVHRVPIDYAFSDDRLLELGTCAGSYFVPRRIRAAMWALPKRLLFSPPLTRLRKPILSVWKRLR